jgi:predicted ArsR family transcriptional regulator
VTAALTGGAARLQLVRDLYEDSLTLRQVAARVGISHMTVRRLLKAGDVPVRQTASKGRAGRSMAGTAGA